jgi:integrase
MLPGSGRVRTLPPKLPKVCRKMITGVVWVGWLIERKGPDGRTQYYAIYRDLQGRQRSAGVFTGKREANKAWRDAESDQDAGRRIGDPKLGRQRFRRYVEKEWFPNHVIEATTREGYTYLLNRYIVPEFGHMRMREILPAHVRAWVLKLQRQDVRPPTIRQCKVILDAIFTTAVNDQITVLHAGKGVKTPPVARKVKRIITAAQYDKIHAALPDDTMRLLVETDIESGLRWGELTELRPKDLDLATGLLTVSRVVVHLKAKDRPDGVRFLVKDYPKDKEWRQLKLAEHLVQKLKAHIHAHGLGSDDLLFSMPAPTGQARRRRPEELPDPETLGLTEPNDRGRRYRHGTLTAYQAGRCRCQHCKDAVAAYRAGRRAQGKDGPRPPRTVAGDGHISGDWFRTKVWAKALEAAKVDIHVTPHGLRHAHASWLLAAGADLQVVKERLGHGSITTTEQYLHALPDAHDDALKALAAYRAQSREAHDEQAQGPAAVSDHDSMTDPRDAELAQLREMVAGFRRLLGA